MAALVKPGEGTVVGHGVTVYNLSELEDDGLETLSSANESDWDALAQLIEECMVETDIADLAHQHDHYLYGKLKSDHHFEQAGSVKSLSSE